MSDNIKELQELINDTFGVELTANNVRHIDSINRFIKRYTKLQQENAELRKAKEKAETEVETLRERVRLLSFPIMCRDADWINGKCKGYQKGIHDDEPSETCKRCKHLELYEDDEEKDGE